MSGSLFVLEINLLSVVFIHTVTAKVAVITDKWVQNSQTTVIGSLANF